MPCRNHPDVATDLSTCSRCGWQFCRDCLITLQGQQVCAGCKGEQVQDIKSGTLQDQVDLAGRGARFAAALIDGLALGILMSPITISYGISQAMRHEAPADLGIVQILLQYVLPLLLGCVYEGVMLSWRGQTLGKMAVKIKVVRPDGSDLAKGQAWGRALSRILMQATYILGLVDILLIFSQPRTCLHDRLAKTRVITWKR